MHLLQSMHERQNIFNDSLAILFTLGLIIVYIPQYYKIIKMKSSVGFSLWFMFLGQTACWLSSVNASIYYIPSWWRCHGWVNCTEGLMGFMLLVFQWFLYWIQYIIFIKYYPKPDEYLFDPNRDKMELNYKLARVTFIGSHAIMITSALSTLWLLYKYDWVGATNPSLRWWGSFLDAIISIMFLIHYIPQIVETIRIQSAGSISLISLGIMTPGSFLWTYFLATQGSATGNANAHSPEVWVPYLLVAISQFCLLSLCIHYEYGDQIRQKFQRNRSTYQPLP